MIKVVCNISPAMALRSGGSVAGPAEFWIDPKTLSKETRELLSQWLIDEQGAGQEPTGRLRVRHLESLMTEASLEALLDAALALRAEEREKAEARAEARAKETAAILAYFEAAPATDWVYQPRMGGEWEASDWPRKGPPGEPEARRRAEEDPRAHIAKQAIASRVEAELARLNEQRAQAIAEKDRRAQAVRAALKSLAAIASVAAAYDAGYECREELERELKERAEAWARGFRPSSATSGSEAKAPSGAALALLGHFKWCMAQASEPWRVLGEWEVSRALQGSDGGLFAVAKFIPNRPAIDEGKGRSPVGWPELAVRLGAESDDDDSDDADSDDADSDDADSDDAEHAEGDG